MKQPSVGAAKKPVGRDSVEPINCLYSASLDFINREILLTARAARRALEHLDRVGTLEIPELKLLAHQTAELAVRAHRAAINRRHWEIRQLSTA